MCVASAETPFSSSTANRPAWKSPIDGVREMLRVLKPGGKLAMAVWSHVRNNPFHYLFTDLFERHFAPEPPQPDAPDACRFAPRGKLLAAACGAGRRAR